MLHFGKDIALISGEACVAGNCISIQNSFESISYVEQAAFNAFHPNRGEKFLLKILLKSLLI